MKRDKFTVTGMTCSACSSGIERVLRKLDGVEQADVSLLGERLEIVYDETKIDKEKIWDTVQGLGYGIEEYRDVMEHVKTNSTDILKRRFFFSLLFLVPLMYFSMGGMIHLPQPPERIGAICQAVLALAIIIIDFKFFTNGTKAILHGAPNMDTLVSLGAGVSYIYSLVLTVLVCMGKLHHIHLFYESAGMILSLVTLGKWLEEISKRKTGDEIEKLIELMPSTVTVEIDGAQKKIPFAEIRVGDVLIVKQGDYVPIDGKIIEGNAFVDRSAITGESMPLELSEGDAVTGADIVKSGFIKVLAQKVGADTTLSQIVKMVKEAGASKAPLQKIADKISGIFVPAVTLIAVITFCVWLGISKDFSTAINYGISVLVISCPCSLGLATPVAVMT
ncbi:MAG: heavy metal translocating P-type ATPase, partial [Clostridia bacterium]|nr:heavy metal translocating P-type ATPase [Clostridia bacterium]